MTDINTLFSEYQTAKANVAKAENNLNQAILNIRSSAGASFTHEGQLYQIRVRNGSPYIVPLKRSTKEWLADAREKRNAAKAAIRVDGEVHGDENVNDEESAEPTVSVSGSDIVIG